MKHSTPHSRAATRDYWTSEPVVRACWALDYSLLGFLVAAFMVLGSINL